MCKEVMYINAKIIHYPEDITKEIEYPIGIEVAVTVSPLSVKPIVSRWIAPRNDAYFCALLEEWRSRKLVTELEE